MHRQLGGRRHVRPHRLILAAGLCAAVVLSWPALAQLPNDPAARAGHDRATMQRLVVAEAVRSGAVPAPLALALADVASDFVPRTAGATGRIGLMQLLPATAKTEFGAAAETLWDPVTGTRLGLRWLDRLRQRYDGDWVLALSHYWGGELRKVETLYRAHDYTRNFVRRVMQCWRHYRRDPVVRAWIREARGVPRFVSDETAGLEQRAVRSQARLHWNTARHADRGDRCDRVRCCLEERCPSIAVQRRPPTHSLGVNTGRRWTGTERSAGFGLRGERWIAVTGGVRFR